jgi:hypothetical protein
MYQCGHQSTLIVSKYFSPNFGKFFLFKYWDKVARRVNVGKPNGFIVFFALLGSAHLKAAQRKTYMKLAPNCQFHKHFTGEG